MKSSIKELKPKDLRFYPELAKYKGKTTKEIKPVSLFSFQKRGFEALDFGMDVRKKGFNIYVAGEAGSGKTSNVRKYIEDVANVCLFLTIYFMFTILRIMILRTCFL